MRVFVALGAIASISTVSWRSSLRGGCQSHNNADGKLGEHLAEVDAIGLEDFRCSSCVRSSIFAL